MLCDEHGAGETKVCRHRDTDEHDQQREMEHQVPGLTQVALFGRHTRRCAIETESLRPKQSFRGADDRVDVAPRRPRREIWQPGEVARRRRWPSTHRPQVPTTAWNDATGE